jgi:hypothetical protein
MLAITAMGTKEGKPLRWMDDMKTVTGLSGYDFITVSERQKKVVLNGKLH